MNKKLFFYGFAVGLCACIVLGVLFAVCFGGVFFF